MKGMTPISAQDPGIKWSVEARPRENVIFASKLIIGNESKKLTFSKLRTEGVRAREGCEEGGRFVLQMAPSNIQRDVCLVSCARSRYAEWNEKMMNAV